MCDVSWVKASKTESSELEQRFLNSPVQEFSPKIALSLDFFFKLVSVNLVNGWFPC